jgi:hypothetical protein
VRLGTCVALELAVAIGGIGGIWLGVGQALDLAGNYVAAPAEAAGVSARRTPMRVPGAELYVPAPAPASTVFGAPDEELLAPLGASPLAGARPNKGGTSLSLRLDFAAGGRASFKPEQIHPQSDPRREVAAYRIDRLLGIGHVPPAKPIKLAVADLVEAADPPLRTYMTRRITDEAIARDGELRGMVSWWIPEIRDAKIGTVRVDEPDGMRQWISHLQVGAELPEGVRDLVTQLVTCVVFDVVIDNADRWSGANTKASPDQQTLYFMDNTLSFSTFTAGHEANLAPLRRIQVFPRQLITRLRGLTLDAVTRALDLGDDPVGLAPLLSPIEIRAILSRRDRVLRHVDGLIALHGEDAVLALP